jgi:hypothetical protein
MKKHLYLVNATTSFEIVVYAESREAAEKVARENAEEEFQNYGKEFDCSVMGTRIPKHFHDSYPYGKDAVETVGYMLSDGQECQDQQWETN